MNDWRNFSVPANKELNVLGYRSLSVTAGSRLSGSEFLANLPVKEF